VLVVGRNGAGKTTLLEALHVRGQGFSPRTRAEPPPVRLGRRCKHGVGEEGRWCDPGPRGGEWLDPTNQDITSLVDRFADPNEGVLTMHPVSTEVNNVRNNDAALIDPV